jgi:hypothetical protein
MKGPSYRGNIVFVINMVRNGTDRNIEFKYAKILKPRDAHQLSIFD